MANSSLNLTSLDFDTLKDNFKNYLKEQSVLKDYDFDGSNINVLLDVMSYNTYLNSFYLNMIASEMFMDSAQKMDSVISHAKELNYVPKSKRSSKAFVNFNITCDGISGSFNIPKKTTFYGSNANGFYVFTTAENNTYLSPNSNFTVANLAIYDGFYHVETFIVDWGIENQRFLLPHTDIDTSSLEVIVTEDNVNTTFTKTETLYGLTSSSNVFFVQAAQNNQYEIIFGDAFLGRRPKNGATVYADYRVCLGPEADGVTKFDLAPDLGPINGGTAITGTITSAGSSLGAPAEDIETIRFRAPRYFATQQRAVSSDDYSSLIIAKFGGDIDDVIVYGGQELEPKQYGRVVVSLKPAGATIAPNYLKSEIINYMQDFIALPNRVIISDPDYFYVSVNTSIQYDKSRTNKLPPDIKSVVTSAMVTFSKDHIEKFGNDFRYSKFVAHIDNSDTSITSNDTHVKMVKRLSPLLNYPTSFVINYNNIPEREGYYNGVVYVDERVLRSSTFTYATVEGVQYPLSYMEDDGAGNIVVYALIDNTLTVVNPSIGSINYDTGRVNINDLMTSSYDNYISLYLTTKNKDIIAKQNMILILEASDISTSVIETIK